MVGEEARQSRSWEQKRELRLLPPPKSVEVNGVRG